MWNGVLDLAQVSINSCLIWTFSERSVQVVNATLYTRNRRRDGDLELDVLWNDAFFLQLREDSVRFECQVRVTWMKLANHLYGFVVRNFWELGVIVSTVSCTLESFDVLEGFDLELDPIVSIACLAIRNSRRMVWQCLCEGREDLLCAVQANGTDEVSSDRVSGNDHFDCG